MSFCTSAGFFPDQFQAICHSFLQAKGLPFADVLPIEEIQAALAGQDVASFDDDDIIYTPPLTLWAFL